MQRVVQLGDKALHQIRALALQFDRLLARILVVNLDGHRAGFFIHDIALHMLPPLCKWPFLTWLTFQPWSQYILFTYILAYVNMFLLDKLLCFFYDYST